MLTTTKLTQITAIAQTLSIVFSFIKMGVTAVTYHRFESQHIVGRHYPWINEEVCEENARILRRSTSRPEISSEKRGRTDSVWTPIVDLGHINNKNGDTDENKDKFFRRSKSADTNEGFKSGPETRENVRIRRPSYEMLLHNINCTDDDKLEANTGVQRMIQVDLERPSTSKQLLPDEVDMEVELRKKNDSKRETLRMTNMPDDDILDHIQDIKVYLREHGDDVPSTPSEKSIEVTNFDRSPSLPPPPRPTSLYLPPFVKLNKLKDMILFDAQHLIKTHVPHLPPGLFDDTTNKYTDDNDDNDKRRRQATTTTSTIDDTTDFIQLPTRKRTINGLEQDDIFGKYICFLGWFLFLVMRMLALATFSAFHLRETISLCLAHYLLMLLCLYCETRSHTKLNRKIFYAFLAYIYIFCLIEFKIKFVHIKTWYVGYFFLVFTQNLSITMIWYLTTDELLFSWWFQFMWYLIVGSAILSILCHIFYYFTLRPKDKILFVNDDEQE